MMNRNKIRNWLIESMSNDVDVLFISIRNSLLLTNFYEKIYYIPYIFRSISLFTVAVCAHVMWFVRQYDTRSRKHFACRSHNGRNVFVTKYSLFLYVFFFESMLILFSVTSTLTFPVDILCHVNWFWTWARAHAFSFGIDSFRFYLRRSRLWFTFCHLFDHFDLWNAKWSNKNERLNKEKSLNT